MTKFLSLSIIAQSGLNMDRLITAAPVLFGRNRVSCSNQNYVTLTMKHNEPYQIPDYRISEILWINEWYNHFKTQNDPKAFRRCRVLPTSGCRYWNLRPVRTTKTWWLVRIDRDCQIILLRIYKANKTSISFISPPPQKKKAKQKKKNN